MTDVLMVTPWYIFYPIISMLWIPLIIFLFMVYKVCKGEL